jgi:PKD repeat protein
MLGGGFGRVRLSGSGWFWSLLLGVYLVASVHGFTVVEAAGDKPTIWITIHRIQSIDSIEGPLEGEPDWYYKLEVWDGDVWQNFINETILVGDGVLSGNNIHSFTLENLVSNSTHFYIILYEKDTYITIPEIADISGNPRYIPPDQVAPPPLGAIYHGWYDLISGSLSGDILVFEDGWYKTSGDFDGSTSIDENDADLWFSVVDDYDAPIAEAGANLTSETGDVLAFSGSNSTASGGSSLILFEWDFDGDSVVDAVGSNVNHQFDLEGEYVVTLKVTDSIGEVDEDSLTVLVMNREPLASFSWLPAEPTVLDEIEFNDTSIDLDGFVTSWFWDFGDGETSFQENPIHQYEDKGVYTVTLVVTDDDEESGSVSSEVSLMNVGPTAGFTFYPEEGTVGVDIRFMDRSLDPERRDLEYLWFFDDEGTSTEKNPLHAFGSSGTKTVRLTVTDDEGQSNTITREIMIFPRSRPVADFYFTPNGGTIEDVVQFEDKSVDDDGFIASWSWDFGDGDGSSRKDTEHSFTDKGVHYVTLTVEDNDGNQDAITKPVTVANIPPTAGFSASTDSTRVGEEVRFTDESSDPEGGMLVYDWDFGDGSSSSEWSPVHEYDESGEYAVVLKVSDDEGASDSASVVIQVQEAAPRGIPGFPLESVLAALLVSFLLLRAWSGRA